MRYDSTIFIKLDFFVVFSQMHNVTFKKFIVIYI